MSPRTLAVAAFLVALAGPTLAQVVAPSAFAQCVAGCPTTDPAAILAQAQAQAQADTAAALTPYSTTATLQGPASVAYFGSQMIATGQVQPAGSYATTPQLNAVSAAIPSVAGLLSANTAASTYQPLGNYATTTQLSAVQAAIPSVSGFITSVNGITPMAGAVSVPISSVGNVSGLAYFHRYSNVTLTVPSVGLGAVGTGTASVSGTAAGDQCFVAPTAATTALGYVMASGWVTTAGTVKVTLAAGTLVAISAGTVQVNMLCAQ